MNGIVVMDFVQKTDCGAWGYENSMYGDIYGNRYGNNSDSGAARSRVITLSRRPAAVTQAVQADTEPAAARPVPDAGEGRSRRSASGHADTGRREEEKRVRAGRGRRTGKRFGGALRLLLLAMIFSGLVGGFCVMTGASSRPVQPSWKYYTTVTLANGESLEDLAGRYGDRTHYDSAGQYVEEVCEINGIPFDTEKVPDLRPGTRIVIPYYSTQYK